MKTDAVHDGLTVQLQKHFSGAGRDFVLDLSLEVTAGITIIFGQSGAGKTTLLDCIAGLTTPDSGKITIGNRILFDLARATNVPVQHRKIGYVFQDLALFRI
jgi:molybdate transport system ATP-binding protein